MKMLNRSAISVKLKQPFVDWVNSLGDETDELLTLADVNQESTCYLVPELEEDEDLELLIEEHYLDILENELFSWAEDTSEWPELLDRELFDAFILLEPAFMVFDLDDSALMYRRAEDADTLD